MNGVRAFDEELKAFAADLRRLRLDRGNRSYRELATRAAKSKTGIRLPVPTQSDAFRGDRLPGLDGLMGLVRILHSYDEFGQERPVPPHNSPELEPWRRRWRDLAALAPLRRSPAPEPAAAPARANRFVLAHVLTTRTNNNYCAAFSPDGRILAVSGEDDEDTMVQLWDPVLGLPIGTLNGQRGALSLAFSPDSKVLAVGDMAGTVGLWDTTTLRPTGPPLPGSRGSIDAIAFTPDGGILVAADDEGIVHRWRMATEETLGSPLIGHSGEIRAMACLPDGGLLAAMRDGHAVRVWDLTANRTLGSPLIGSMRGPLSAAFSADGSLLATVGREESALWDTATSTVVRSLDGAAGSGAAVAFSQDGRLLATMSGGGTVRLWNPSTGAPSGPPLTGHNDLLDVLAVSPDGRMIAACGETDALVVYHDRPHAEPAPTRPLAARALASALREHQAVALPPLSSETGVALRRPAFSPDGGRLLVRTEDRRVLTWDPAARVQLPESLPTPGSTAPWGLGFPADGGPAVLWTPGLPLSRPLSLVRHVAFCGATGPVAVIGAEGRVSVLNTAAAHVPDGVSDVYALAAGPEWSVLAAAMGERVVLWDPADRAPTGLELEGHLSGVGSLAFSPDGKLLATGDIDGHVMLWDVTALRAPGRRLSGHTGPVHDLAFSPQGHRLASASEDGTVQLWDPATGRPATDLPLTGHAGAVRGVAFSPDASLLASAGDDGTVRCWLVPTARAR
ncbi:WD40 repeat domain-containing protein [Streptomyces sp. NBC_00158]|uniref:WD40 repeat domain-containing protein n=1 Tax=Streptomyces sp. NBC_00158 TaxID=2903627 RepID=UPI003246EC93